MRISDWSSDVCSSDLRGGASAWRGLRPCGADQFRFRHAGGGIGTAAVREISCLVQGEDRQAFLPASLRLSQRMDSLYQHHRPPGRGSRSEEHTSELQSLMRISYAVFCLKKKNISDKDQLHNT